MCCSNQDCTALDSFPLYWVEKLKFKKAKTLDKISSADREVCLILASLGVVLNTTELIKHGRDPTALSNYLGIGTFH